MSVHEQALTSTALAVAASPRATMEESFMVMFWGNNYR